MKRDKACAGRRENRPAPPLAPQTEGSFYEARAGWWLASFEPRQKFTGEGVSAPPECAAADAEREPDHARRPSRKSMLNSLVGMRRRVRNKPAAELTGLGERVPDDVSAFRHRSAPLPLRSAGADHDVCRLFGAVPLGTDHAVGLEFLSGQPEGLHRVRPSAARRRQSSAAAMLAALFGASRHQRCQSRLAHLTPTDARAISANAPILSLAGAPDAGDGGFDREIMCGSQPVHLRPPFDAEAALDAGAAREHALSPDDRAHQGCASQEHEANQQSTQHERAHAAARVYVEFLTLLPVLAAILCLTSQTLSGVAHSQ